MRFSNGAMELNVAPIPSKGNSPAMGATANDIFSMTLWVSLSLEGI